MKIIVKTKNISLTPALRQWINQKLNPLEKFLNIFQKKYFNSFFGKGKPRVEIWLEIGKTTLHHQKGKIFRAEAQLRFPGKSVRTTARSENLRRAITEVKDELQREFKQYKGKLASLTKRRQRGLKKILRLAPAARFKRKKGVRIREEGI